MTVPKSVLDIEPDWLTGALGFDGVTVTHASATAMAQGEGVVGELARLEVSYDSDDPVLPRRLIAKAPTRDPGLRMFFQMAGLYEVESAIYRHLGATIPIRIPRCYFNHADVAAGSFLLLLEDLAPAAAFDQLQGATREVAEIALRQMARLHAAFWDRPELDAFGWLPCIDDAQKIGWLTTIYPSVLPEAIRRAGDTMGAPMRSLCERLGPLLGPLASRLAGPPRTLVHGDYRLDNLLLGPSLGGDGIAALDWQLSLRGNAAADLAYFLVGSLEPDRRRAWQPELVRFYCEALRELGIEGYSPDQAEEDMRANFLLQLATQVMLLSGADLEAEDRIGVLARTIFERNNAYCDYTDFADLIRG
jgi:hypothetical protein